MTRFQFVVEIPLDIFWWVEYPYGAVMAWVSLQNYQCNSQRFHHFQNTLSLGTNSIVRYCQFHQIKSNFQLIVLSEITAIAFV